MRAYRTTPALVARQRADSRRSFPHHRDFEPDVRVVPLSEIEPNRFDFEEDKLFEYERSLRKGKRMPPIHLRRRPGAKLYEIRDGTHRDLASRGVGFDGVPALVERERGAGGAARGLEEAF